MTEENFAENSFYQFTLVNIYGIRLKRFIQNSQLKKVRYILSILLLVVFRIRLCVLRMKCMKLRLLLCLRSSLAKLLSALKPVKHSSRGGSCHP